MKKWIVSSIALWMAVTGSAVLLTYEINHPLDDAHVADAMAAYAGHPTQAADEPVVEVTEPGVLQLPMVTIVTHRP
jgi:hypothetical protein